MGQEPEEIFSKISSDERLRLFKDIATVRGELICKGDSEDVYRFTVERAIPVKNELQCSIPFGLPKPDNEHDLLGNFFIGGERYFFKTSVKLENDIVILRMDTELFHLQRRQNYRIRIPEKYQAQFLITFYNKTPVKLNGKILDLSSAGCRVALVATTPLLTGEDRLEGQITIGPRDPLNVEGTVRHHKNEKSVNGTKQTFGLEFASLSPQIEGKLFAITLDLHREFFSRLNTKN